MTIGERIKEKRLENNMLQSELAKMLHVTQATVSSWEVNRTEPNMGMIDNLCKVLNCDKADLLGLEEHIDYVLFDEQKIIMTIENYMNELNPKQIARIKAYADYLLTVLNNKES